MTLPTSPPTLNFTGERFIPHATVGRDTEQEHLLRYQAALPLAANKVVLDAACGEGYGSNLLAQTAIRVAGIDLSEETIKHARGTYGSRTNLHFDCGSVTQLPYEDSSFDLVISFETIEHIGLTDQKAFLHEIHRVLKPDGILIISTPNRINYSERTGQLNKFHVCELTPAELLDRLDGYTVHRLYRQSTMAFSSIWVPGADHYHFHGKLIPHDMDDTFVIAVCGREQSSPPSASLASLSYQPELSYNSLRLQLIAKEQRIEELGSWGKSVEQEKTKLRSRINELQDEVIKLGGWGRSLDAEIANLHVQLKVKESNQVIIQNELDQLKSAFNTAQEELTLKESALNNITTMYDMEQRIKRISHRLRFLPRLIQRKLMR